MTDMQPTRPTSGRRRKAGPGTRPADTAGGELERRIGRVEFAEGAFVRLRVPIPASLADPGRDVLTDIDVLSVDVDNRLRVTRASFECKSGAGQSGEPAQLIWLAGFRQFLKLDRVSLARISVSNRGRKLAQELSIVALDEHQLRNLEEAHAWIPQRFAHIDGEKCSAAEARVDTQLKGMPAIPLGLTRFIRGHGALAESSALLSAIQLLGRYCQAQGVLPEPAGCILAGHSLVAVILAGIQDASRLDQLGEDELRRRLGRALTVGSEDSGFVIPLLEKADAVVRYIQEQTHRQYVEAGAEPLRMEIPSLRDTVAEPPDYLNDYVDFVGRLRANPLVARDLLQTAELVCFEALLGGTAWQASAFSHLFTSEHRGLLLVAVRTMRLIAGKAVSDCLQEISSIPFNSDAGRVPDRRADSSSGATARKD